MNGDFLALLIAVFGSYVLTGILAAVLCTRGHLSIVLRRKPEPRPAAASARSGGDPS